MKVKQNKQTWEEQYGSGTWDYLSSESEFAHYSMVAAYVQKQRRPISLLDLGCGEGILLRYLDRDYIKQYTGVDFAQTALNRVDSRYPTDKFVCASLEDYTPERKWDVVLFNEVLYFMPDPLGTLEKFNRYVEKGGVVIVSMHQKKNPFCLNNRCFRQVSRYLELNRYPVMDRVQVNNGCRWEIFVYQIPDQQRN